MKNYVLTAAVIFTLFTTYFAQTQRDVLVEVFTNSYCPLCPNAHNTLDNYLTTNPNGNKINYIYYHMVYPYSDDQLYLQSSADSDDRHAYYNPVAATPRGFFDGVIQTSVSGWTNTLNNLTQTQSPLIINLSGSKSSTQFFINAEITRTGNISDNDLVLHFIVVEDVYYDGRNSVSNHKHVMRKMLPTSAGLSFSIDLNQTKMFNQTVDINPLWDADSLSIVIFAQSTASKTVYQSETISYQELSLTNLINEGSLPEEFLLYQNFPNPFNPSTVINYSIPKSSFVTLKVYDILGNEVAALINQEQPAGRYNIRFDAAALSNGIYFYTIKADNFSSTKKMILMK